MVSADTLWSFYLDPRGAPRKRTQEHILQPWLMHGNTFSITEHGNQHTVKYLKFKKKNAQTWHCVSASEASAAILACIYQTAKTEIVSLSES